MRHKQPPVLLLLPDAAVAAALHDCAWQEYSWTTGASEVHWSK
jgi:hypothetical protein